MPKNSVGGKIADCLCDFCSAPDPEWRYPARNFIGYEARGMAGESVGAWAACQECHQLIASGDHTRLTERSVVTFIALRADLEAFRTDLEAELAVLHKRFFENRNGASIGDQLTVGFSFGDPDNIRPELDLGSKRA